MDDLLIKPAEAAALLGVSRRKLYDLMQQRLIPYYCIDGPKRLAKSDVIAYRESCKITPGQQIAPKRRNRGTVQVDWGRLRPTVLPP